MYMSMHIYVYIERDIYIHKQENREPAKYRGCLLRRRNEERQRFASSLVFLDQAAMRMVAKYCNTLT